MTVSNRFQGIESDAEEMINSLFAEIDQILEQDNQLQTQKGRQQNHYFLSITERPYVTSVSGNRSNNYQFPNDFLTEPPDSIAGYPNSLEENPYWEPNVQQLPSWVRHLDKIVFSSSCSLLLGILFFLQKQEQLPGVNFSQFSNQIPLSQVKNQRLDSDLQFLTYMERSLEEINQETQQKRQPQKQKQPIQPTQSTQRPPSIVISSLPSLPPPPAINQPQTTSSSSSSASSPASKPANQETSSSSLTNQVTQPNSPPTAKSKQESSPSPPTKSQSLNQVNKQTSSSPPPTQSPPSKPTNQSSKQLSQTSKANKRVEKPTQLPSYKLVGVLELGEHSAALLKINDTTQRVMLGETIPGSNWKLTSITNQQATFENNNQQKLMSVGQKTSAN